MFLLCDFEKLFWVISKLFFGKSVFLPPKIIGKSVFLGVIFMEKMLIQCYPER